MTSSSSSSSSTSTFNPLTATSLELSAKELEKEKAIPYTLDLSAKNLNASAETLNLLKKFILEGRYPDNISLKDATSLFAVAHHARFEQLTCRLSTTIW